MVVHARAPPGGARREIGDDREPRPPAGRRRAIHSGVLGRPLPLGRPAVERAAQRPARGPGRRLPTPGQLAARLDPGDGEILVAAAIGRPATDLDGQPGTVTDTVLRASRRP